MRQEFSQYFDARHWIGGTKEERAQGKRIALRMRRMHPDSARYGILSAVYSNLMIKPLTDDEWLERAEADLARDPRGLRWYGEDM